MAPDRRIPIWLVLVIGGFVLAGGIAAVVLATSGATGQDDAGGMVKIELRAKPPARMRMNGKLVGTTPMTVVVKRSEQPLELEAMFSVEKYGLVKPAKKVETWRQIKLVVPDAEQAVDFNVADAIKVDETLAPR